MRKRSLKKVNPVAIGVGAFVAGYLLRVAILKARTGTKQYYEPQSDGSTIVYFGSDTGPTNTWVKMFPGGGVQLHV